MVRRRSRVLKLLLTLALVSLVGLIPTICGCGTGDKSKESSSSGNSTSVPAQQDTPPRQSTTGQDVPGKSEQALQKAAVEKKPVLLCFHSLKCAPCIQIEQNLNQVMPEYKDRVEFVIVDVYDPAEYNLCMQYGIQTIPTTVFIRSDGQVKNALVGVMSPEQLREQLNALLSN